MTAGESPNDAELTDRLRQNDHAAFNEIYERYWRTLFQTAYGMLKDQDAAQDVVQEIFVWLWMNRERHLTDRLQPYLRAAVKYQVAKLIRHGKVKTSFFDRTLANYEPDTSVEQSLEVRDLQQVITAFTQTLPDRAREIYRLSREELLTNKEIAERLHISEKTVENQMTINLRKLRTSLGKMSFWTVFL